MQVARCPQSVRFCCGQNADTLRTDVPITTGHYRDIKHTRGGCTIFAGCFACAVCSVNLLVVAKSHTAVQGQVTLPSTPREPLPSRALAAHDGMRFQRFDDRVNEFAHQVRGVCELLFCVVRGLLLERLGFATCP
jgi:hypothetical protein